MQPQLLDLFGSAPSFDNFVAFNNEIVIKLLQESKSQFTHIAGAKLSGKTHLLQAWVNTAPAPAIFVSAGDKINLRNLADDYKYIAIDNIDCMRENQQIQLFDLFNKIKLNNRDNFLLTSSSSSLELNATIRKDLKTRILSGLNLHLKALNDTDLRLAITIFTTQEGISLAEAEINYLINHYARSIGVLIKTIHKLAEVAVIEKRNITIPFIKQVLGQGN